MKGAGRRINMSPTNGPDARNQSRPVGEEDEDEMVAKNQNVFCTSSRPMIDSRKS